MPSTGTPSSKTARGARSVSASYADMWLPERMMPLGANSRTKSSETSHGMDFAVDAGLAHAACDQLRVLRAEIEDEDFFVMHYSIR